MIYFSSQDTIPTTSTLYINTNQPTNQPSKPANQNNVEMQLTALLLTILPLSLTTVSALPNPDGSNTVCLGACARSDAELQCEEPYVCPVPSLLVLSRLDI